MSRFFSRKYVDLEAYTPGEQPSDQQFIKLNTNESPFPPSPGVAEAAKREAGKLNLYSDPESAELTKQVAERYGVRPGQVLMTNGSDEILNFAFMAFGDADHPFVFPDVTYAFYEVFGAIDQVPVKTIPLRADWTINYRDYCGIGKNIVIANPNAPTGLVLPSEEIEEIIRTNPDNIVIIDEAYVDFGNRSALPLVEHYDNLLVTRTFSKSRSLAGARLGFGIACEALIQDLNTIKYSTNPYNVNRMTAAAGIAALEDDEYYMENARTIMTIRDETAGKLREMGISVTDSHTNFLFVSLEGLSGEELYQRLKQRNILVRRWNQPRIENWCRVTVGTREQMGVFLDCIREIKDEVTVNG